MIYLNFTDHRGWRLSINRLKAELGFKEWPKDGVPLGIHGGHSLYVKPAQVGAKSHRATVVCGLCSKEVSYGRIGQHLQIHR